MLKYSEEKLQVQIYAPTRFSESFIVLLSLASQWGDTSVWPQDDFPLYPFLLSNHNLPAYQLSMQHEYGYILYNTRKKRKYTP
jgi:hypothetical protein